MRVVNPAIVLSSPNCLILGSPCCLLIDASQISLFCLNKSTNQKYKVIWAVCKQLLVSKVWDALGDRVEQIDAAADCGPVGHLRKIKENIATGKTSKAINFFSF